MGYPLSAGKTLSWASFLHLQVAFGCFCLRKVALHCCSSSPSFFQPQLRHFAAVSGNQWHLQPDILDFPTCCICQRLPCFTCATPTADFLDFDACCICWGFACKLPWPKEKKSKTQAATTGSSDKVATAAADTATADAKGNTKGTSTEFQAFISDLEASPSFNPLCHASAGHGCNTSDRQEEELPSCEGKENAVTVSAKPSFTGLFSTNRRLTMDNKLSKFQIDEGTITLEPDDLTDVRSKLGFCIVGYVAGKFPGLQAIRTLSKSWGASFQRHDSGWLVFRFARDDDRQRILAGGPYFIYGRPLLLKVMPDCFEFKEDDISLTPVWAILPSLPLECWHPNARG
ncbi:hypothetical protein Sango_1060800 [Sesamum angolense]|uniref:DUF4283 domain-containing protein n=1 Tax=Sesamum angolense TaxID=2727404 RepID=A0AAE1X151_9LAMI|nr:hypothetical protein Sango_1060800 [Sesamum angolense]